MSKVKGPLFSLDASGTIGDTFFFSKWKSRKKVSKHFVPKNPQTFLQQLNREFLAQGIQAWRQLSPSEKEAYNILVQNKNLSMSGYNYYLSEYITAMNIPSVGPIMDGMLQWTKFDETGGSIAYDSSPNNNLAHLIGGADFQPGKINNCIQTYGGNSYGYNETGYNLNSLGSWTIMFWVYWNLSPDAYSEVWGDEPESIYLRRWPDGGGSFTRWDAGHTARYIQFFNALNKTWYHFTVQTNGTRWRLFVNAVEIDDIALVGGQFDGGDSMFYGRAKPPNGDGWPVKIDDFMIYNRYLSPEEILNNYNYWQ